MIYINIFIFLCVLKPTLDGKKVLRKDGICHQPVSDYKATFDFNF